MTLFALLTPPFGVRAYLDARAQDRAASAQVLRSFGRPAASVVKSAASPQPFAQVPRSPLDAIKGKGAWYMIFDGDWTDPDADRAAARSTPPSVPTSAISISASPTRSTISMLLPRCRISSRSPMPAD